MPEPTLKNALRDAIPYMDTVAARSESLSGEALMPKVIADTFREWTEADPLAGVRDFWTGVVDVTREDLAAAQAELVKLRAEAEHRAAVSEIVWRRMREATERWQKAHPEINDVDLIWPDLGEMLYWLLERITILETDHAIKHDRTLDDGVPHPILAEDPAIDPDAEAEAEFLRPITPQGFPMGS